jgi:hypothetical protein
MSAVLQLLMTAARQGVSSSVLSVRHQLTQEQSSYQEQLVEDRCTTAADNSSQARCLLISSVSGASADPGAVQLPGAAG